MKTGPVVSVPLSYIVPAKFRGSSTTPWKVARAMRLFQPGGEGQLYPYKGRYLSDGQTVELIGGHNRVEAMRRLNIKTALIQIIECTDEEFFTMYVTDNSKEDDQVTEWALSTIAAAPEMYGADYTRRGLPASKMYDDLRSQMGLKESEMIALREIATALKEKQVPPEFAKIADITLATYFWRRVRDFGPAHIDPASLLDLIGEVKGKNYGDGSRNIRLIFAEWREERAAAQGISTTDLPVRLSTPKRTKTLQEKLVALSNQISLVVLNIEEHTTEEMDIAVLETLRKNWLLLDAVLPGENGDDKTEVEAEEDAEAIESEEAN